MLIAREHLQLRT